MISFNSCGLAANLVNVVRTLGGTWIDPWCFEIPRYGRMELCGDEDRIWSHKIREAARLVRWRQVLRRNFPDVDDGVDTYTSGQLSRSNVLTPWEQGILRSIQADAVWTCAKLHRAGEKIVTPMCPACGQEPETMEHLVFECQCLQYQTIRAEFFPTGLPHSTAHLSPLTRNTLLVPHDGEAHIWRERTHDSRIAAKTQAVRFRDLICLRAGVDDDEQNQRDSEMTVEMWERASWDKHETSTFSKTRDHRIEVWTDGSAKEKDSPWAHAGAGVTWGSEHLPEISVTITRRDAQSNDRAELEAMLCATLSTDPPVAVMTDNEWVSKGANLLLEAQNNDGEARLSQFHGSHCEVWVEIQR